MNNITPERKNALIRFLVLLSFLFLSFLVYSNSLRNNFVFSDHYLILNNPLVRSLRSIPYYFKGYISENVRNMMYRPLTMLTYNVNFFFSRYDVRGYRILNIILHAVNAGILCFILWELFSPFRRVIVVLFPALIFLLHPLNSEAVNYLSARSTLLVTFFIFSSLYYFLRWLSTYKKKFQIFSFSLYLCALLAKENALIYPFVLTGFVFLKGRKRVKTNILLLGIYFLTALGFVLVLKFRFSPVIIFRPWMYNFLTQVKALFLYLKLFIFPSGYAFDHQYLEVNSFTDFYAWVSVSGLVFLVVIFLIANNRELKFALLWLLCFYSWKFFVQLRIVAMEHHFYLPEVGLLLILPSFLKKIKGKSVLFTGILFSILFLILGSITYCRNSLWRDEVSLSQEVLSRYPDSQIANYQIALELKDKRNFKEAIKYFKKVLTLKPDGELEIKVLANIVESYLKWGKIKDALNFTAVALKKYPYSPVPYRLVEEVYFLSPLTEPEKLLSRYSENIYYFYFLSDYYYRKGNLQKAEIYLNSAFQRGLKTSEAYRLCGDINDEQGKFREAIRCYREAIRENPLNKEACFKLGTLLVKHYDYSGVYYLKKVIQFDPFAAPAYYNLGLFYLGEGNKRLAAVYLAKARDLGYVIDKNIWEILRQLP